MSEEQTTHPKPLAFTKSAGGLSLIKAVYRSGELWQYCQTMPNSDALYTQYLENPQIVVLDDSTLLIHRLEQDIPQATTDWASSTQSLEEILHSYGFELNDDEDDDE